MLSIIVLVWCVSSLQARPSWEPTRNANTTSKQGSQCPSWTGYDYKAVYGYGPCLPCSVFDASCFATPIASVPYPHSSYDYSLDPPQPQLPSGGVLGAFELGPNGTTTPHILVSTWVSTLTTGVNTFAPLHPAWSYSWSDFRDFRNTIVWNQLDNGALTPGVYKVELDAWDYRHNSGVCSLCFSISDTFRPQSTEQCPSKLHQAFQNTKGWLDNVGSVTQYLALVDAFIASRQNNDCSSHSAIDSCRDITVFSGTDWFGCRLLPQESLAAVYSTQSLSSCVQDHWKKNPFYNRTVLAAPASYLSASVCSRQLGFNVTWQEPWTEYSCDHGPIAHCGSGVMNASDPEADKFTCANTVTLAATPSDFVREVSVSANTAVLKNYEQYIPDPVSAASTVPSVQSQERNTIHLWTSEDATGAPVPLEIPIQHLVTVRASRVGSGELPTNGVFWRWQASSNPRHWHSFANNTIVKLQDATTTLKFEAWTHCGLIQDSVLLTWKIVQHTRPTLNAWFHASWHYSQDPPHCATPSSDFGVVSFDGNLTALPPTSSPSSSLPLSLSSIVCKWAYTSDYPSAPSSDVWTWLSSSGASPSGTFAIKLLDAPRTHVTVECILTLDIEAEPEEHTFSRSFWFENCDKPTFNHAVYADESCVAACAEGSWQLYEARLPAPFQACAGNLVYPAAPINPESPLVETILQVDASQTCCATCNLFGFSDSKAVSCVPLNNLLGVSRCEPVSSTRGSGAAISALSLTSTRTTPLLVTNVEVLLGGGVILVLVCVGVFLYRQRSLKAASDAYSLLLDDMDSADV